MTRHVRATMAAVVSALLCGLAACGGEVCPPKTLASIEARYSLAALKACKGYGSLAECPAAPELKEKRRAEQEAASCR